MNYRSVTRRGFFGAAAGVLATLGLGKVTLLGQTPVTPSRPDTGSGPYSLPELSYGFDALEPHIDARTMQIHYGAHHAAYVRNLNAAVTGAKFNAPANAVELIRKINDLPEAIQRAVRNNGGGHVNHTLFWSVIAPNAGGAPSGALARAIDRDFGSFTAFKEAFEKAGAGVFGSGWAWLCVGKDGKLFVTQTANQDNPVMDVVGATGNPVLGCDVWEHAYYLQYQNKRADYLKSFWNVVNWSTVSAYASAAGLKVEQE